MKRILTILTITITLTLTITAQTARPLRVYLASGVVDKMALSSGSSLYHSRLDLDGVEHDDYVSLVIADGDGERRYMLSQVDSLVMPNGRRVVFQGSMTVQPSEARLVTEDSEDSNANGGPLRSSFSGHFPGQGQGNVTFYWTENDRIRLDVGYESRARQLTNNKTDAQFVFDSADLDAASYTVYYPGKSVTILSEQTQTGADNSDHIGPSGDCGTATAMLNDNVNANDNGTYSFTLEHKAAYLCFLPHIDYLPSVRIEKIVLTCNNAIAGTYQLASGGLYNSSATSNTITLNLIPQQQSDFFLGHSITTEQDSCAAYMVIAPQDASRSFTATYYLTDTLSHISKVYRQTFSFQPLANTVYPISCNIRDTEFRTIDLGLSVRWSNVNVNATEPSKEGSVFASELEANAALTALSGVTDWLMPDADQQEEILEKCQWTWGVYNGVVGYFVSGVVPSQEYGTVLRIFLPWTGGGGQPSTAACLSANFRPVEALMIDLGLKSGVNWASRNIGATSVTDYGDYYAWGETTPKADYTSGNYLYGKRNLGNDLNISGTQNDAATITWGGLWRMPTKEEWEELKDSCTWTWETINGVNGYVIEKKVNGTGNKIFLPSAGVRRDGGSHVSGYGASYPTSIQGGIDSDYAWTLYWNYDRGLFGMANTEDYNTFYENNTRSHRYAGRPVRAVASVGNATDVITYGIRTDSTGWHMGDVTASLYGTFTATKPVKTNVTVGFVIGDDPETVRSNALFDLSHTMSVAGVFSEEIDVYDNLGHYYRAYVDVGDSIVYGEAKRYGYNLVDMGLPSGTLWANMNLGANEPEEYGYYYAWGETEPKTTYNESTYEYGTTENIGNNYDIAGSQYDAAHIQLGNAWCMPTKAQMEELLSSDNCTWTRATRNSMNGYLVTSKVNGNTLFFPDAGVKEQSTALHTNIGAVYHTSTHEGDGSLYSYVLAWCYGNSYGDPGMRSGNDYYPFYSNGRGTRRYWGRVIRPVYKPSAVTPEGISLVILTDSATWKMGDTEARIYGTFTTSGRIDGGYKVGFVIGDNNAIDRNTASREYIQATVDGCQFDAVQSVSGNLGYWYRAFVEANGRTYYGEAKHFGIEMVDMGLSVKWANVNVGASIPEEYGNYYAWGETTEKSSYSSDNYLYSTTQNLGNDYDIAGTPMDAAAMNMGGGWRMPTRAEMQELLGNCDVSWVLQNGVKGYRFTSRLTGNTLFFPSAGVRHNSSLNYTGFGASYPTSTMCDDGSSALYVMAYYYGNSYGGPDMRSNSDYYPFYSNGAGTYRYWGYPVRAVSDANIVTPESDMMHIVADSVHWKLGDNEARLYATFNHITPIDGSVTIGIVAGDSIYVTRGTGRYQTEKTVTGADHLMLTVPVANDMGYWYKPYVVINGVTYYGNARHFGLEMIDLGLPSRRLWANMNVGASTPEEYGNYYAWGETSTKPSYDSDSYLYGTTILNDGNISGNINYDAAYKNMSGNIWRTPTKDEMQELLDNCTWSWVLQDGVKGYRGVSIKNGKTIFLPSAGYYNGSGVQHSGYGATYMTATQMSEGNNYAYIMAYRYSHSYGGPGVRSSNDYYPFYDNGAASVRYYGRSVRAVANQ